MYVTVAKKHFKDCGSDQISLTLEKANLKNYVFGEIRFFYRALHKHLYTIYF